MICQCLADLSLPYPPPFSPFSLSPTTFDARYVGLEGYYLSTIYSQEGQVRSTRTRNVNFSYNIYFLHGLSDSASFDALIVGLNDLYVKKDKTENQCKKKQAKYQDNFTALSIERKVDQIELRINYSSTSDTRFLDLEQPAEVYTFDSRKLEKSISPGFPSYIYVYPQ